MESASALRPCVGGRHRIAVVYSGRPNQDLLATAGQTIMIALVLSVETDQLRGDAVAGGGNWAGGEFGNVGHRDLVFF